MGNNKSKESNMKPNELNEFINMTSFPSDVLIKLYDHFKHFSSLHTDDGIIDYNEFCAFINK